MPCDAVAVRRDALGSPRFRGADTPPPELCRNPHSGLRAGCTHGCCEAVHAAGGGE